MKANSIILEDRVTYEETPDPDKDVDQDGLWKQAIYELLEDFIGFFLPDMAKQIDYEKRIEFLDTELLKDIIDSRDGKRYADQIVKVQLKSGKEKWILIHIEVQGKASNDFSKRMFQYFYRIYDKYDHKISAIAVMTKKHEHAKPFFYQFYETNLQYHFATRNLFSNFNEQNLMKSDNIFSRIVLAARYFFDTKKKPEERLAVKRQIIYDIYFSNFSPVKLDAAIYFITYLLRLPEEMDRKLIHEFHHFFEKERKLMGVTERGVPKFFQDIYQIEREKGKAEGEEIGEKRGEKKGIEKGMEKGDFGARIEIARNLLASGMPVDKVRSITKLPIGKIEALAKEMKQ